MPREGWPKESSSGSLSTDYSCFDGSGLPLPFADCTNTERCISTVGVDLETSLWESEGAQVFADGVATPRTAEWKRQNQPGKEMHSWLDTARDGGPKASRVAHTTMKQKEPGEETRGLVNCLRKTIKLQERDTSGQGQVQTSAVHFCKEACSTIKNYTIEIKESLHDAKSARWVASTSLPRAREASGGRKQMCLGVQVVVVLRRSDGTGGFSSSQVSGRGQEKQRTGYIQSAHWSQTVRTELQTR